MRHTILLAATCGSLVGCGAPEPPDLDVLTRASSPSGHHQAVVYTLSGGGAAGWVLYRVAVGEPGEGQRQFGRGDVAQLRHAYGLEIAWVDDSTLIVKYPVSADIDTVVPAMHGIRVRAEPAVSRRGGNGRDTALPDAASQRTGN